MPILKVSGVPGTTYRIWPGAIFKNVTKRLGITIASSRYSNKDKAMQALDAVLDTGKPVGILGSVFYLPYLPEAFRFHFNAHNLVAYGRQGNDYLISDPIMEGATTLGYDDLVKCRFAKGVPEPNGFMYHITGVQGQPDKAKGIELGIKQTCFFMAAPLPWFGNKAIFLLANRIQAYPRKLTPRKAALYLGNIIRMQEEIGTGGAGFRYLFAAFLQEAGQVTGRGELQRFSEEMTHIGDQWRGFAYSAARIMKARGSDLVSYDQLADQLRSVGVLEREFFAKMRHIKW